MVKKAFTNISNGCTIESQKGGNKKLKNKNQKKTLWNLKKLREEAGIKQYKMAEMLGYAPLSSYYCKKEKGMFEFRLNEMIKIKEILSEALGRELTLEEIFCE